MEGMREAGVSLSLIAQIGQYKKHASDQDKVKAVSSINSQISDLPLHGWQSDQVGHLLVLPKGWKLIGVSLNVSFTIMLICHSHKSKPTL